MQPIRIMSKPPMRIRKWTQFNQFKMNIYQSNTNKKELCWLTLQSQHRHADDSNFQEMQQAEKQYTNIPAHAYRNKKQPQEKEFSSRLKAPIVLEAFLATETMLESQSNLVERDCPSIFKDYFSSRTHPTIFKSVVA